MQHDSLDATEFVDRATSEIRGARRRPRGHVHGFLRVSIRVYLQGARRLDAAQVTRVTAPLACATQTAPASCQDFLQHSTLAVGITRCSFPAATRVTLAVI